MPMEKNELVRFMDDHKMVSEFFDNQLIKYADYKWPDQRYFDWRIDGDKVKVYASWSSYSSWDEDGSKTTHETTLTIDDVLNIDALIETDKAKTQKKELKYQRDQAIRDAEYKANQQRKKEERAAKTAAKKKANELKLLAELKTKYEAEQVVK